MSGPWWEDGEDGELAAPAVPRRQPQRSDQLWAERYPRPERHAPPPGLSWAERRRWTRDVRRADRQRRYDTAASWRNRPPEQAQQLGLAVLVVVGLLCAAVWWRVGADPGPAPVAPPVADADPGPAVVGPSAGASTTAPADGHDHEAAPPPPAGLFDGPAGETAYAFVLGYLDYSPAVPDPVGTWLVDWRKHATDELVDSAEQRSTPLWDFTVQQAVHVVDPQVVEGVRDGDSWTLTCAWTLFPIGGDETSATVQERVTVEVSVTDGLVSSVTVSDRREAGAAA